MSVWNGSEWITVKATQENPTTQAPGPVAGSIISPPSILDDNSGYIPAMLTAVSANVSDATLASSSGIRMMLRFLVQQVYSSTQQKLGHISMRKYGKILLEINYSKFSFAVIDARAGVILSQPTVSSSNGDYIPTVLTVTPGDGC